MRNRCALVAAFSSLAFACANAQTEGGNAVVRLDPALDALIAPDARLERLATGFGFTEGTTWVPQGTGGFLLFSDIPANVIDSLPGNGKDQIEIEPFEACAMRQFGRGASIGSIMNPAKKLKYRRVERLRAEA